MIILKSKIKTEEKMSSLFVSACEEGDVKQMVKHLIGKNNNDINEGFYCACSNGHIEIAKMLIQCGATNFNEVLFEMYINVLIENRFEIIKLLVGRATNFNDMLAYACSETIDVVKFMIEESGHEYTIDDLNSILEHQCRFGNNLPIVKYLIEHRANKIEKLLNRT